MALTELPRLPLDTSSPSASAALATTAATGPFGQDLCCQAQPSGAVTEFRWGGYTTVQIGMLRIPYSESATSDLLGGGTYEVGYCVKSYNGLPVTINNNDRGHGWVMVTN